MGKDEIEVEVVIFDEPISNLIPFIDQDFTQLENRDIEILREIDVHVIRGIIFTELVPNELLTRTK